MTKLQFEKVAMCLAEVANWEVIYTYLDPRGKRQTAKGILKGVGVNANKDCLIIGDGITGNKYNKAINYRRVRFATIND